MPGLRELASYYRSLPPRTAEPQVACSVARHGFYLVTTKVPTCPNPRCSAGQFKLILDQIIGQTQLLIFLILGGGTNEDLVVSRVGVDVVVSCGRLSNMLVLALPVRLR